MYVGYSLLFWYISCFAPVGLTGHSTSLSVLIILFLMMKCLAGSSSRLVLIASKNPAKVNAAKAAVQRCFPFAMLEVRGVESQSGVPDQPVGDEETLQGAINRINSIHTHELEFQRTQQQQQQQQQPLAAAAAALHPDALLIAIEGGVLLRGDDLHCFAWAAVKQAAADKISTARSAEFLLPPRISQLVLQDGLELGAADDAVFGRQNSGRGNGTVGRLTYDLVTRACYYEHIVTMALIPYINPDLYPGFTVTMMAPDNNNLSAS